MVFSRAHQYAAALAMLIAARIRRPASRRDYVARLLDLPQVLLDDMQLPQDVKARMQQEREIQKISLHISRQR